MALSVSGTGATQLSHHPAQPLCAIIDKARDVASGEIVAIKRVKMHGERGGLPQSTLREIMALRQLDHEHVVR